MVSLIREVSDSVCIPSCSWTGRAKLLQPVMPCVFVILNIYSDLFPVVLIFLLCVKYQIPDQPFYIFIYL